MDLAVEWMTTLAGAGATPQMGPGSALLVRWAEPQRHYHTVTHLAGMLSTVDTLAACARDAHVVRLAAWYHDAVYQPRADDNEERSARLAEVELAALGLADSAVAEVARLVRLTSSHAAPAGDANGAVLCDADLAVLAAPAPDYAGYVRAVREEYSHIDDTGWRAGRGAVLRRLLTRPAIFLTRPGRSWEQAARDNLNRELASLAACGDAAQPR